MIGPKSKKDIKDSDQPSKDDPKASLRDALLEHKEAQEAQAMAAEGFFLLFVNLLIEDARFHWDKIISSQSGAALWTNLQGNEHEKERGKDIQSFQVCITFHLLDMIPSDAAEQHHFYISNVLKKPQRVPVRYFFQQVEQLNGYLLHLPCIYNSPRTTAATKLIQAFKEAELANLLLCMCSESWQDQ
jgi:hypothetical protein